MLVGESLELLTPTSGTTPANSNMPVDSGASLHGSVRIRSTRVLGSGVPGLGSGVQGGTRVRFRGTRSRFRISRVRFRRSRIRFQGTRGYEGLILGYEGIRFRGGISL